MDSQSLKTDKQIPIELPEICAPRLGLLERFDKAAAKRCVYVSAPAGCGKTVSTLLWLKKSDRKTIWIGLDKYDNTPAGFYRFFYSALFAAIPQEENLMAIIRGPAFSASPVEYTMEVLTRFAFDNGKYALVFDDFHLITDEEIQSPFYVIKAAADHDRFNLSRTGLPAAFIPMEEGGKIASISASIRLNSEEIRGHFVNYGLFITARRPRKPLS